MKTAPRMITLEQAGDEIRRDWKELREILPRVNWIHVIQTGRTGMVFRLAAGIVLDLTRYGLGVIYARLLTAWNIVRRVIPVFWEYLKIKVSAVAMRMKKGK